MTNFSLTKSFINYVSSVESPIYNINCINNVLPTIEQNTQKKISDSLIFNDNSCLLLTNNNNNHN